MNHTHSIYKQLETILTDLYDFDIIESVCNDCDFNLLIEIDNIELTISLSENDDFFNIQYYISNINIKDYDVTKILYDSLFDYDIEVNLNEIEISFWVNIIEQLIKQGNHLKNRLTKLSNTVQLLQRLYKSELYWVYELLKQELDVSESYG